jgi:hypothetical protein
MQSKQPSFLETPGVPIGNLSTGKMHSMPRICKLLIPLARFGHDRQIALLEQFRKLPLRSYEVVSELPGPLF